MFLHLRILLIPFVLAATFISSNLIAEEIPLDHFIKHSDYIDIKLSPDGKHFAARLRQNERIYLNVVRLEDGAAVSGVNPDLFNEVRDYVWVSNERLIYTIAEKRVELDRPIRTGEIFGINIDGSRSEMLAGKRAGDEKTGTRISTRTDTYATFEIISVLADDPKHILIAEYPWDKQGRYYYDNRKRNPVVHKMNVFNGRQKRVEIVERAGADLYSGTSGKINFATYRDEKAITRAVFRPSKDAEWQDLGDAFGITASKIDVLGVNASGDKVYLYMEDADTGLNTIFELQPETKSLRQLFTGQLADIQDWVIDQNDEISIGISAPDSAVYHYDAESESEIIVLHKMLRNAFKGQTVSIESITDSGDLAIVHVRSDINPGEYYLFDTQSKHAQFLWANYSWIDPRQMHKKKPIKITARDGLEISGYLTMPKLADPATKAPLIVLPHGGPHGVRDFPDFDWEVQLLANRGYAVLQPNFRGSGGYGEAFKVAGHREWGGKMIDDIIDATNAVLESHSLDPARVCVYGHSFGAYAAMMATIKAPTIYKCTVGSAGLYDLTTIEDSGVAKLSYGGAAYMRRAVGDDPEKLRAQSPVFLADKITSELLIIHGKNDIITPKSHYTTLTKALKNANKKYQSLLISDAGHGPYNLANRQEHYSALLKFFDQHLGK